MPKKRTKKAKARKMKKTKRKAMKRQMKKVRGVKKTRKVKKIVKRAKKTPTAIGKVTHYYDKIGVAIIELKSSLHQGDTVTFRRGDHAFTQRADSMQIEHAPVASARKGDIIGLKVKKPVKDGAVVLKG